MKVKTAEEHVYAPNYSQLYLRVIDCENEVKKYGPLL